MAIGIPTDPRRNFVPRILPWLLAAAAFALYAGTLNRWVSLFNLSAVAKVSGWTWQPEVVSPVFFVVTYPFRWLPAAQIPLALNLFTAVCAALTLGLLARTVALLPQDRTDAQRRREHSDFSFLTIASAWLPPVLAVLVCGLQLTFWEQATNCAGEMFDLLLFAFVIWSLVEYRLDEREGRLFLAALVYGAGMAENWAMVGFFPVFLAAIIWLRGWNFFNLRFLGRMFLCGLAGLLSYLLLPLLSSLSGNVPVTFWEVLKVNLVAQKTVFSTFPRGLTELPLLITPLAVFVLAIRWRSAFGDRSQIGSALATFVFHLIHAFLLGVCLWLALDPPFSPRHLGLGLPFLTFYFFGALSIGYYSGYFLLIFGKAAASSRPQRRPALQWLNRLVVLAVWLAGLGAVAVLACKNTPQIRATNDLTFQKYAALMEEDLPRAGGIVLSDDPRRLLFLQAALARDGRAKDFVPLDTPSLVWPQYLRFLHDKFPRQWPELVSASQKNQVNPLGLVSALALLAKTNELYYLHPSFGYYFEEFYSEPHGLVYRLQALPEDTLLPPPPGKDQIAANETFWTKAGEESFGPILRAIAPPATGPRASLGERLFARLHIARETNQNAVAAGNFYSRSLDSWGVQLQRAGELEKAALRFDDAQKLNPDNVAAQVNLQFNQSLRAGQRVPVDLSRTTADQFGKYRTWLEIINDNGPFDEPSFCFQDGVIFVQGGLMRQAVAPFERVRELAPDNLAARLWLGQLYIMSRLPDRALEALRDPLEQPAEFALAETNSTQLNVLAASAYFQKNDIARGGQLLSAEIARHPANEELLAATMQAYLVRGLFTNALVVIDHKLRLTPGDPQWLFNKGYASIQVKKYDDAITALNRVLSIQTNNSDALFNRAIAWLNSGQLDAARADYTQLQQTFTNSFQIAYGLGEIAWRRHETNEAVRNYKIYLANAATNTAEATNILQRLRDLQGQ